MAASPDWLAASRRAGERVREALAQLATPGQRSLALGRGEGGDTTLAVDRAAEDAVLAELEALRVPLSVISEERGELSLGGGGPPVVVVDPIDGSLNAKRGLPFYALSLAVADARTADTLAFGYVTDLPAGTEWWAERGAGAFRDGERLRRLEDAPLEALGLETARPGLVAEAAPLIRSLQARRLRALGSVALSLCLVADGRLDAMLSLRTVRSVDVAAGLLIVNEAGGASALPDAAEPVSLGLEMRSRVIAARSEPLVERLLEA